MIRFDRGILIILKICLSSFVGILLGPSDLPIFSDLIIFSILLGAGGLKKEIFSTGLIK